MIRRFLRCDICAPSTRPGLLWLGGADWVECPQCRGSAKVEMIREDCKPRGRGFIAGSTQGFTILHPEHARMV